jgi:hypothetical protein
MVDTPEPHESAGLDAAKERALAVGLFNRTWDLLDTAGRTGEQDDEMIHGAHASRYHWGQVGEPVNLARGEWQCSRVYAMLGRPEPALWHARRSLEICERHGIGDFDLAFAYEALARASALSGDRDAASAELDRARAAAAGIADADDRETFLQELGTVAL